MSHLDYSKKCKICKKILTTKNKSGFCNKHRDRTVKKVNKLKTFEPKVVIKDIGYFTFSKSLRKDAKFYYIELNPKVKVPITVPSLHFLIRYVFSDCRSITQINWLFDYCIHKNDIFEKALIARLKKLNKFIDKEKIK